ncbi:PucR family transcriptional regulator ligand-binding domain-containing protein [Microbacterium schleiferi]|uniref:PucR family transcriptional regulator ligand-binding domain-containing protein n=1 Tax=Microbacterium schleiferi TaxID=69362 RepID=A0A7S8MY41_9MICO|nr:PucR family transcriptional regulator ligand-binding domain-containing protein [Microbacterium schleiferi]QPE04828.1 PucR family transcriptional regulator ligand-binding domain-containing protein [Microbacterium schleiferi]
MPATLGSLLADRTFGLRAVGHIDPERLDLPVSWVHNSDLPDPTPWLEPGQLLLTDGGQFLPPTSAEPDAYCIRLRERGVAGLGFATNVIHPVIPDDVIEACRRHSVPLIEVPRATPFIGIIRHVADVEAADRSARLSWTLESQRALARAAVRHDGLREILRTLSSRLGTWVALFDAAGRRLSLPGIADVPASVEAEVDEQTRMLLRKSAPASVRVAGPHAATLQTIGQAGRLRGVLAVGADTPLDSGHGDLVESVIALASISLEQQRAVSDARLRLRTGVLELLIAGRGGEAARSGAAVWGRMPSPPLLAGRVPVFSGSQSLLDELELMATAEPESLFFAEREEELVLLVSRHRLAQLGSLLAAHDTTAGFAELDRWAALGRALAEAAYAAQYAREPGSVEFAAIAEHGVMGTLRRGGGALVARRMLTPLDALPAEHRDRLVGAARAWLDANTAWDPAARALGIHRHTLRARIDELGELLDLDLSTFGARAQLWAALELAAESGAATS